MQYDPFQTGQLLLPDTPPAALTGAGEGLSMYASLLVAVSVLLFLLALRSFLNVLPYLSDNILRARGSAALENSVRVSRDRNLVAAVFLIPAILLIYRYKLIDAAILDTLSPDYRLLAVAGLFLGYLVIRYLLYRWLRPRRRYDDYQKSYRTGYTFFILLMALSLIIFGSLISVACIIYRIIRKYSTT